MSKLTRISVMSSKGPDSKGYNDIKALNQINSDYWSEKIENVLDSAPDIIILPENCDRFTDFSYKQQLAYITNGGSIENLIVKMAKKYKTNITYPGIRIDDKDNKYPYRNCIRMYGKDGSLVNIYDKNHVMIDENEIGIGYGQDPKVYQLDKIRIASGICFDLNFDTLIEAYKPQNPELIIFSSNYHGGLKQDQWAYSLRSYMASAITNNTSRIINPFGDVIACTTNYYDHVTAEVNLDFEIVHLDYNIHKIKQAKRKFKQSLTVYDPGNVATVLLTYEDNDRCIKDVLNEYEIETYDEYLKRTIEHRKNHIFI